MKILWFLFLNLQVRWMMCLGSCPFSWFWHFLFPKKKKSEKWEKEKWRGGRGSKASRKIRTGRLEEMRKRSDLSSDCRQSCFRDFFFFPIVGDWRPHAVTATSPWRWATTPLLVKKLRSAQRKTARSSENLVVFSSIQVHFLISV